MPAQARAKRVRKPTPIAERRAARKAARETCKAAQRELKTWIPAERKRVAGQIAQLQAQGVQQIGQLRAQLQVIAKGERAELAKRIKAARAAAKLGECVDRTAGPALRIFGPKKPEHLKKGSQQRMFSSAPSYHGGKPGAAYRVRGQLFTGEAQALAAVLRHLQADEGGIVVLEHYDGHGGYTDGVYYGIDAAGQELQELDPLDPHGHQTGKGRAAQLPGFAGALAEHKFWNAEEKRRQIAATKTANLARELERRGIPRDNRPKWGGSKILIRYGVTQTAKGWAPVVEEQGRRTVIDGRPADREAALEHARTEAQSYAARYVGDYDVKIERLPATEIPPAPGRSSPGQVDHYFVINYQDNSSRRTNERRAGSLGEAYAKARESSSSSVDHMDAVGGVLRSEVFSPRHPPPRIPDPSAESAPAARKRASTLPPDYGRRAPTPAKRGRKGYSTMPPSHSSAPPPPAKKKSSAPPPRVSSRPPAGITNVNRPPLPFPVGTSVVAENGAHGLIVGWDSHFDDRVVLRSGRTETYARADELRPAGAPFKSKPAFVGPTSSGARSSKPPPPAPPAKHSTRPPPASSADARPSWGHEWNPLGWRYTWRAANEPIARNGLYGEETRPHTYVQYDISTARQFRHGGSYGWQLREKAGKVQLHVKPYDYWSTIGDAEKLTFGELYAACVLRLTRNLKELRQLEGEWKPKRRTKATLPTTAIPHHGTPPTEWEVAARGGGAAGSLSKIDAGAAKLITRYLEGEGPYWIYFEDGKGDRNPVAKRKTLNGAKSAAASLASKYHQPKIYGWLAQTEKGWSDVHVTSTTKGDRRFWIGR
jgi:hypothetical protein